MLITGREARAVLLEGGVSDRRARLALQCGLAGPPVLTRAAHLFERQRVEQLGRRRVVSRGEALRLCPRGYFLSRGPVDVDVDSSQLLEQISHVPGEMSTYTTLWFHLHPEGGIPLVATVAGFVVAGATITHAVGRDLTLEDPGEWYAGFEGTQMPTRQGRQWAIVDPRFPRWAA